MEPVNPGPTFVCPVCGYPKLFEPAWEGDSPSYEICPSCGTEFGYTDWGDGSEASRAIAHVELRAIWKDKGCPWRSQHRAPPPGWDPIAQLKRVER